MDDDENDTVLAYTTWQWDCECGYVNTVDHDPSGEDVECDDCDRHYTVSEVR